MSFQSRAEKFRQIKLKSVDILSIETVPHPYIYCHSECNQYFHSFQNFQSVDIQTLFRTCGICGLWGFKSTVLFFFYKINAGCDFGGFISPTIAHRSNRSNLQDRSNILYIYDPVHAKRVLKYWEYWQNRGNNYYSNTQKKSGAKLVPQRSRFGKRLLFAKSQNSATKGSVLRTKGIKQLHLPKRHQFSKRLLKGAVSAPLFFSVWDGE